LNTGSDKRNLQAIKIAMTTTMSIQEYSPGELEPRKLSKEEMGNPYEVVDELFSYGHLSQLREALWEWLKLTVSGSYHHESRRDRANLLHLYEKLKRLREAAHIIYQSRDPKFNDTCIGCQTRNA
jgi:hypothetical protein